MRRCTSGFDRFSDAICLALRGLYPASLAAAAADFPAATPSANFSCLIVRVPLLDRSLGPFSAGRAIQSLLCRPTLDLETSKRLSMARKDVPLRMAVSTALRLSCPHTLQVLAIL